MDTSLHNVSDLPLPQRSAIEMIIGHALRDDQQLYIAALDAAVAPTADARRQVWAEIGKIIAEAQENVRNSGISAEELDRMIDEACHEVRYGT